MSSSRDFSLGPSARQARVLLVEDEAVIRDTVALALQAEGFQVVAVEDGQQALEQVQGSTSAQGNGDEAFALIVLDLLLPFINGLDVCRFIRQQSNTTPILILSAKMAEADIVVGLEVGADDYLTKPFSLKEFIARCRVLLRNYQGFNPQLKEEILSFQDLALNKQQCQVTLRGEAVTLSPKEFSLLEVFMQQPGRVRSREDLIEKVWGLDFMGDSKTVDVHIRWLREKIEADPSNPQYLITVRGFGYRLG
ncbi:response regulator transcription factor [Trichocoleus sp. FACHB-262]|uniref:response regulator transcription factor n=1 Tax=Trichocoleus sp. FACHB-262 TaxID=2692869 RepID=UPI0016875C15|nr:response regulator transcription factor [Trichocoleus sp. FACHB-262]MBD2124216.1 response regulator transcription factor [Trichocoleus sp. FACHB-262]